MTVNAVNTRVRDTEHLRLGYKQQLYHKGRQRNNL